MINVKIDEMIDVRIKKLTPEAVVPEYSKPGDAGLDLVATSKEDADADNTIYGTGLVIEIPEGYMGLIFPRSSIWKRQMSLANSVGVIDSGYRGEVKVVMRREGSEDMYQVGDRIAQLVIMPYLRITFTEVEELGDTERGEGGFGSTGR